MNAGIDHNFYDDDYIRNILTTVKTIAVVGASPKQTRPSYIVVQYLISKGYDVIPVNPGHGGRLICGVKTCATLSDIDRSVDMVDIFRNSTAAGEAVNEALSLNPLPKVIWMQLQIRNDAAAKTAQEHGIKMIMDRCPKIEYVRLLGEFI